MLVDELAAGFEQAARMRLPAKARASKGVFSFIDLLELLIALLLITSVVDSLVDWRVKRIKQILFDATALY